MKNLTAILTALALAFSIAFSANAACINGIHSPESCYDNGYGTGYVDGWVVGFAIGAGIAGGIAIVAFLLHNNSSKPGTVVSFDAGTLGFEGKSSFFLQPDVKLAADQKLGFKTGIQW